MKRSLSLISALALVVALGPTPVFSANLLPDVYADLVVETSNHFLGQDNILGPPDRAYADSTINGSYLMLDMGEGEEGLGDLTVYFETHSAQSQLNFDFYDADNLLLHSYGNFVPLRNTWVIEYPLDTPYRYVKIKSNASETIRIDAIASEEIVTGVVAGDLPFPNEDTEPEEDIEIIDTNPLRGSLVKLVDDWNDDTEADKVIYMLDADNNRHIIPNETVFRSWGLSFDDITIVGEGTLTGMSLGKNVTIRPGSYLVKIERSPEVYAVEAGGVLRWIPTEELAEELYGEHWSERVVDVPETLFVQYGFGGALTETAYPGGSFLQAEEGGVWYIDADGMRWSIGPLTLEALDLSDEFLATGMSLPQIAQIHEHAGHLIYQDSQRWPF